MGSIKLDCVGVDNFIGGHELGSMQPFVDAVHGIIHKKTGPGADFLGWLDIPNGYSADEIERIRKVASNIRKNSEVFVVVGIGGSYLGAKAAIEMLSHSFASMLDREGRGGPIVLFAGQNISSSYMNELVDVLEGRDFSVNVISKSGTTTEPAIAFRILKGMLEKKYGMEGAGERIVVTTDEKKGALRKLSNENGYETFTIPDDVGGRYSVLTPVGLLPMSVAGIDIEKVIQGSRDAIEALNEKDIMKNDAYKYAALRNILYKKGMSIEMLVSYEPALHYFAEWWKQLFGESEGKDSKGLYPASAEFSTDLHSLGQYIQDGRRILFETVMRVENPKCKMEIPSSSDDTDGLGYIEGRDMDFVNQKALEGTMLAHIEGGVPNIQIKIPELDEHTFGYMAYFFEKACAASAYMLGVNPFDQPGVESYKKSMFKLLGKPGY